MREGPFCGKQFSWQLRPSHEGPSKTQTQTQSLMESVAAPPTKTQTQTKTQTLNGRPGSHARTSLKIADAINSGA